MKISKYLSYFLKDFFAACGCLMVIISVLSGIYSTETMESSLFWQIMLLASAYTFFKYAFTNRYELTKKAQLISVIIYPALAGIMIVLWLCLFSPGKIINKDLIIIYTIISFIVQAATYAMMYIDGHRQAKQLNEKLREYKNGDTGDILK